MTIKHYSRSISIMPRRLNLLTLFLLIVYLLILGIDKIRRNTELSTATSPWLAETSSSTIQTNATVIRVVDGDTLAARLDGENKEFTVRLLGVNTPETVDPRKPVECFGKEASAFAKKSLTGKRIRLEADPLSDERDKYDRLLRKVITEEGIDFNAALVREGYAYAYLSFPLNPERKRELNLLQEEAKVNKRGLWSPEACK